MTLVELMVAVVVLSIGALGVVAALAGIQKALQISKSKTFGANLSQEQMQILKQKSYYQVLVTTDPVTHASFADLRYDNNYFTPESVLEGGVTYTRYTLVEVADEDSGAIVTLSPTTPDTGMRLLTINTIWRVGGELKRSTVRSILSNPDTVQSNAVVSGTVSSSTGPALSGAIVTVSENQGWRDTTSAAGSYSIDLSPGNYTLMASAQGYFPELRTFSISANSSQSQNFALVAMSSGSVILDATSGRLWLRSRPVISQIVVSTIQADTGMSVQFVELYNPTTFAWTVSGSAPELKLNFQSGCSGAGYATCKDSTYGIKLSYSSGTIPAGGYYLIANTSTFVVNGSSRAADAVFADDANSHCTTAPPTWNSSASPPIKSMAVASHNGTFWLTNAAGTILDAVGWSHASNSNPPHCETGCITLSAGAAAGEQFVRLVNSTYTVADLSALGRGYDSGNNQVDITSTTGGMTYSVFSTASSTPPLVSGTVPTGAVVTATDGLSASTQVVASGSPPVAKVYLTQVATGTWTVYIASGNYLLQHDTVTISAMGSAFAIPSTMSVLNQDNTVGFVSGRVLNASGGALGAAMTVNTGSSSEQTTSNSSTGRYLLRVSPGTVDVFANPSPGNSSYISQSSAGVTVIAGEVANGVDFYLSQGGRVTGFATRDGVNALPGVVFTAYDANSIARDVKVSDSSGRFTLLNLTTGTYTIEPSLGSHETASPESQSVTVTAGNTIFATTFTISGAMGSIRGSVTVSAAPLRTGALIIASTSTITTPSAVSTATLASAAIYMVSSREDGTYTLEVRGSTNPTYNVYAYYPTISGSGSVTITPKSQTGVSVTAGAATTGVNFAW